MRVKNDLGAAASGPDGTHYEWKPGESVEVPDAFAAEIIAIPTAGFYATGPEPARGRTAKKGITEVDPEGAVPETDS